MKIEKRTILFLIITTIILTSPLIIIIIGEVNIESIHIADKLNEDNTKTITVKISNIFNKKIKCSIENDLEKNIKQKWINAKNNKCSFNVTSGNYNIYIKDKKRIKSSKNNNVEINTILDITPNKEKIILPINGTEKLETKIISIGTIDDTLIYSSSDENVVTVNDDGTLNALTKGNATITITTTNNISKYINITVTDLYKLPSMENNKQKLPCNLYSKEDADMLDQILEYKVNESGYKTRGAVVTTSRFLVLEFPYIIPYFFENGRLNNYDGINYVDGEGRYYKKGLYLHNSKFETIKKSAYGPSIWGCPLTNWQDEYGYVPGVKYPNGLDCSGFVTWALFNAGFDVGDSGAGDTYRTDDIGDLGRKNIITKEFIASGNYKVGDLIGRDGHIAIIAGLDNENIHIAESLVGGVVIKSFNKNDPKFYNLYEFINNMDEVYKEEGTYTNMW